MTVMLVKCTLKIKTGTHTNHYSSTHVFYVAFIVHALFTLDYI